jgi:hypothetical protein
VNHDEGHAGRLLKPGDHPVDVPITCVISRFGLRHAGGLVPSYRDYRRVVREAERSRTPGLLRSAFLFEDLTTWFGLSFWSEPNAIAHFGTNVPGHVDAARRGFGRLAYDPARGPELWSTKWRLVSVSNNLAWDDFDLRGIIAGLEGAVGDG